MGVRRGHEWTAERLAERYVRDGVALRALATESGLAYGTVWRRLVDHGVTMRPRGGANNLKGAARAPRVVKGGEHE